MIFRRSLQQFVWCLSLLFLAGVGFPGTVQAGETVSFAFFSRGWAPFEMVVNGKPDGAAVALFRASMPENIEAIVEMMPAPRSVLHDPGKPMYSRLECPDWMSDPDNYLWSDIVVTVESVLYSPASNPVEFSGKTSLHGLTIGCVRNYFYPEVQSLFESGKALRYDVNDEVLLLRMLKAGRVDVAIFDDVSAGWMIRDSADINQSDFYISRKSLGSVDLRFVFNMNPDWKKQLMEINRRIRQNRADGTFEEIMSRYR